MIVPVTAINPKNGKTAVLGIAVGLLLTVGFIIYHRQRIIKRRYGDDSCRVLLSGGRYKEDKEDCVILNYSQIDTQRCMRYLAFLGRDNQFVFLGDGRVYRMYLAFTNHLTGDSTQPQSHLTNHHFVDRRLKLTVDYVFTPSVSDIMVDMFRMWKKAERPPSMIVAGAASWSIRHSNSSARAVEEYTSNLTRIVDSINKIVEKKTQVLWALQEPLSVTDDDESTAEANTWIDLYNRAAIEVFVHSQAQVRSSCRAGEVTQTSDTQILLNSYCIDHMNYNSDPCCTSPTFSVLDVCAATESKPTPNATEKEEKQGQASNTNPSTAEEVVNMSSPKVEETKTEPQSTSSN